MIFNEKKVYKNVLAKRSTLEKDLRVAPRSTPEQQSNAADLEFVKLDVPVDKIWSIPKGNENEEFQV